MTDTHAGADACDAGVAAEGRHSSRNHFSNRSRYAIFGADPAIKPVRDLVRLPTGRCGFHGHTRGTAISIVQFSELRSITRKLANAIGSAGTGTCVISSASRSIRSGYSSEDGR